MHTIKNEMLNGIEISSSKATAAFLPWLLSFDDSDLEQTIAELNRDTNGNATLTNLYEQDKEAIQTGFAITKGLSQNFNTFMNIMASDMDNAGKQAATDASGKPILDANGKPMTVKQAYDQGYEVAPVTVDGQTINYATRQQLWGSGGTGNIIATALIGAASGNVTGGAGELVKNTAINVVRAYGATEIKQIADEFMDVKDGKLQANGTSETVRGLLHAIAGCAGASATGGSCADAAVASGGTVAMNNALGALLNLDPSTMTESQKQAYSNLMGTLVSGVTSAVGGDAAAAQLATKIEEDNNWLNYSDSKTKAFTQSALNNADSIAEAEALSGRLTPLDIKDKAQTNNLVKACEDRASNSCRTELQKAWNAYVSYSGGLTNNSVINAEKAELRKLLSNYINVSLAEQKTLGFAFNIAVTQHAARVEVGKGIAGSGGDREPSKVVRDIKTVLENPDKLTAGQYAQAGVKGSVNSIALEPLSMGAEVSKADIATRTGLGSVLTDWVFGTDSSDKTNQEMQDILNNRPDFTLKGQNPTAQAVIDTSSFATGIATTIIAPERLLALKNISVTRPLTNAEKLELKAAGIDAGFYKEGWSSTPVGLQTTNGIIASNPNKTTTVLGTYVSDTDSILNQQLNALKNNNFTNDAPGGFNLLNTDNELYQLLGAEKYWEKVNRPFLDAAILRGDDIAIATPPTSTNLFRNGELSGFGREIKYLEEKGFHYDPITKKMVKGK